MNRGQVHTLEAFVAALLLVGGLIFATQATAVTPLSASTSNQHIENQQRAVATDLLAVTHEDGSLEEALLFWNDTEDGFAYTGENRQFYTDDPPEEYAHPLADPLSEAFGGTQVAYNIDLIYQNSEDPANTSEQELVEMGSPSDNAVVASRTVVLFDGNGVSAGDNEGTALSELEDGEFYAPNVDEDGELYNVVEVRITVWRM
ncbi:DUF7288 family protein [Natronorarus salvus]|uniref:DUF7288 family protein n=1 Tax=Natronorarus salvus TaxID=3117733 RepID=UPI002F26DD1B